MKTIILRPEQVDLFLTNLPIGYKIKLTVADANKILDSIKTKKK